jgi:hypothetical protein
MRTILGRRRRLVGGRSSDEEDEDEDVDDEDEDEDEDVEGGLSRTLPYCSRPPPTASAAVVDSAEEAADGVAAAWRRRRRDDDDDDGAAVQAFGAANPRQKQRGGGYGRRSGDETTKRRARGASYLLPLLRPLLLLMDVEPEPLAEDDADSFIVEAFPFIVERLGGGAEMMISMMIDEDDKIILWVRFASSMMEMPELKSSYVCTLRKKYHVTLVLMC